MYAGHAALALAAKGKRPRLPIWLLVPVAFAPDWIQWTIQALGHRNAEYSHSIVSVLTFASIVALGYWLATRRTGDSVVLWLLYLSHWAADLITGLKPTLPGGPYVGLGIYSRPGVDFAVESIVIVACWWVYRRSFPPERRRSLLMPLVPLGLVALQLGFGLLQYRAVVDRLREIP